MIGTSSSGSFKTLIFGDPNTLLCITVFMKNFVYKYIIL